LNKLHTKHWLLAALLAPAACAALAQAPASPATAVGMKIG
jgi:hypothetical protein